jgi:hypothetical protein
VKKELYTVCELCKKEIFDVKDCVEVSIGTKLYFINSIPAKLNKSDPKDEEFSLGGGFASLCADCFFTKDSIKKAILSRWNNHTDLYELAQKNYDQNPQYFEGMKTKSKNKILLKIIQQTKKKEA